MSMKEISSNVFDPEFVALVERGVSTSELERRMSGRLEPGWKYEKEVRKRGGWKNFSEFGFLLEGQSLLLEISEGLKIVESFGTSTKEIAEVLGEVVKGKRLPHPDYEYIDLKIAEHERRTLPWFASNYGGWQECPWLCNTYDGDLGVLVRRGSADDKAEAIAAIEQAIDSTSFRQIKSMKSWSSYPDSGEYKKIGEQMERVKRNYEQRRKGNLEIAYVPVTGIAIHLIGEHSFFEGRGTEYHMDPAFTIQALGLGKAASLVPKSSNE